MKLKLTSVALCALLVGCSDGGNPFDTQDDTITDGSTEEGGIVRDGLPPGTETPSSDDSIVRGEARSTEDAKTGNGFAEQISYNSENDTFTVDGLAFDGDNTYSRGRAVSDLGTSRQPYAVYESDQQTTDELTGNPVNQLTHRAIYGVSRSGNTQFAIVRTGAYADYGFGGFIYQREGGVVLPSETPTGGDAIYRGTVAGLRDRAGAGGLQYATGDLSIAIDFDDFNESTGQRGDGVRGELTNREVFDLEGNNITTRIVQNINDQNNANLDRIPAATFVIGPGAIDNNGEITGNVTSQFTAGGSIIPYEEGNYYAIVSGDNAEEIVGVLVLENSGEFTGITTRETSGFIVYR